MFKELYLLGQNKDAIALFAAETSDQKELDVNQQFTDSLLKLIKGENLAGINQILNLRDSTKPSDKKQWQALRQTPEYWQALFPFPYEKSIVDWSQTRQLNPLLVASLIRQESRFEPTIRSRSRAASVSRSSSVVCPSPTLTMSRVWPQRLITSRFKLATVVLSG